MIFLTWLSMALGGLSQTDAATNPSAPAAVNLQGPTDLDGKALFAVANDKVRFHCLIFLGTECPVSNGYSPEYKRLYQEYSAKGVALVGIHPDPDVDKERARQHAKEYQLPFPIALDSGQKLARAAGVQVTPEVAVLDARGKVVWIGRIDDTWMPNGKKRTTVTRRDLRLALDALVDGKTPPPAAARPFGCPLPEIHSKP